MLHDKKPYIIGIDEAGRGPLIGDMFIAGIAVPKHALNQLSAIGVKDSKKLTPSKREELFPKIISIAKAVIVLRYDPQTIDKVNLTHLTLRGFINILWGIRNLGLPIKEIYIDAIKSHEAFKVISKHIPKGSKLIYEVKADEKYVAVSAASIVAKYLRDKHVEALIKSYGNFGSGYPSDPKTIEWLREKTRNGNINSLPPIVRRSWKTIRRFVTTGKVIKFGKSTLTLK